MILYRKEPLLINWSLLAFPCIRKQRDHRIRGYGTESRKLILYLQNSAKKKFAASGIKNRRPDERLLFWVRIITADY